MVTVTIIKMIDASWYELLLPVFPASEDEVPLLPPEVNLSACAADLLSLHLLFEPFMLPLPHILSLFSRSLFIPFLLQLLL